ncbi:T9SS type B sorting domain-containing protein [Zobellia alginiliquefaciens]|uniref:T9SS type B sorting domain-containing protein n=1 Tax=Zobellia alginiliquefaciens TaxID=3032586 RepID=UPI0023E38E77|nr:T9SS type B sorting domain-containing protein [Zobellia alginiliquefaciens]
MIPKSLKKILAGALFLYASAGFSQEYNSFEVRYQNNIKGDLTFISNTIVNRDGGTTATEPEDPYNNLNTNGDYNPSSNRNAETGGYYNYNDRKNMRYIDVDSDTSTFSSSTATFTFPQADCNLIRYAGLYWSATYPRDDTSDPVGTPRDHEIDEIKFRVPGGAYVDITADEILYDGLTDTDLSANAPYACYADVTSLITPLANPEGDYTIANVPSAQGYGIAPNGTSRMTGGAAGGWTLVIVYENPNTSGKLITTFDGFARVTGTDNIDIPYNGFNTIPVGPVNANIGAATLEGDFRITGDRLRIRAASNGGYTTLSNGTNPSNNFFNSNITRNGAHANDRNPFSLNTLGFDSDIFNLNNPTNSVIPNNETAATFRFQTNGDQYYPFFNSFNIEIIEPDIILEKKVEDIAGNDITGQGVNLGQILDYVLTFQNTGNDDAVNYTIRDILPINVTLDEANLDMPTGTTYTYNPATREVDFFIPNRFVEVGDTPEQIRMRVQVAENCFDFIDACTDLIENLAYSTYEGEINNNRITDDPSVSDFDNCGFVTPGATNFLLDDLSDCNFTRTVQLCGLSAVLDAGDNFDDYVWVRDENGNGQIDASDPVLNDGDPDSDPSTLEVTEVGTYIVDKIVADPCKGFKEIMIVERYGTTQTNPLVDYFNDTNSDADPTNDIQGEIVECSIDGDLLPKFFLCGSADIQPIRLNILDAQSISWEKLDEGSCIAAPDDCANKNLTCTWNEVATGSDYDADTAGKYRLVINYTNGCFSRFYFDVFQNNLDILYNDRDIICNTDGNITITNLGSNYGYQLVDVANNTIVVPFSANNGPSFDIATNGAYRVDVTQLDSSGNPIPDACIFNTPDIGILDRDFQVNVTTTPSNCNAQGIIKIDVLNVEPNYTYVLRRSDGTLIDDETAQPDNTHSFNVNPGNYTIEASTQDGCFYTEDVTVDRTPDPTVLAVTTRDIGCSAGTIQLTGSGGLPNPDYSYAIWSKNGTNLYTDVASIPGDAYDTNPIFSFGWRDTDADDVDEYFAGEEGDYVFVIVDSNNCFAFSNEVTINDNGAMTLDSITETSPSCSGDSDGAITINTTGGVAPYEFSIDGGTTTQGTPNFVNLIAGTYEVFVTDSSGCTFSETVELTEPFPLSASAGVSRDATCHPNGAEVRVTNVTGGTAPYEYSFDGGATYGTSSTATLPPGDYTVIVTDGACEYPMNVTVEDVPEEPEVTLTPEVSYDCDGLATVTATPNISTYNYTYALDGVPNSPDPTSNVFVNVGPGTYTVSTNYSSQTPPTPSVLLSEDFGSGATIPSPNTIGYTYEDQTNDAPGDSNRNVNDFEYTVTSELEAPFGTWINPIDHTSGTRTGQGRYLVMNVGTPTPTQIIYSKQINDVIPNQDLSVTLYVMNLLRQGTSGLDPNLTVEIRETGTTNIVQSIRTGEIAKNTGSSDWVEFTATLNPGANTTLDFIIRSEVTGNGGNDFALDDIVVHQVPEVCEQTVETAVTVVAGNVFTANITGSTDASCNGLSDGSITFEVENFNAAGFEYSIDGGAFIASTTSPVTSASNLGTGSHTLVVRKADETTCSRTLTQTINAPDVLEAFASITTELSCTNGGATITASVTGGTAAYEYQLEDNLGAIIGTFDYATNGANTVFSGLAAGDYIVRVRDSNSCEDAIDATLTVVSPDPIVFDVTATECYSGANDASIQVDVTDGNGNYTFSINGNPWVSPTPSNATTYTFDGLSNGTYTINVQDGFGCVGTVRTVEIDEPITVSASAPPISACATFTTVTFVSTGGDGSFQYAIVPDGDTPTMPDYDASPERFIYAPGDYDVYLRDPSGGPNRCDAFTEITITQIQPISLTATPTDVTCFGDSNGSISITVDSGGNAPFMYSIDDGVTYVTESSFPNLTAGTYPVRVRDADNCETTPQNIIVNEPTQITAEAEITQNYTCLVNGEITIGSVTPTTGGSGDYQYSINGGAWTASSATGVHTFTDLTDDTYSIRVRDANATSCEITLADVIIAPLPTEPSLSTSVSYNCDGTGNITVLPNDASYTYSLDGAAAQPTNIFNDVAIGSHTIVVNYGSDCTVDTTVIVEDGYAFEASITAFENLDCNADSSGTITIDADNYGTGGFEYSLNGAAFVGPFTAAEQITGLAAQAHSIEVRDVDNAIAGLPGCTVVLNQTLIEPDAIIAAASVTEQFTCNNTGATITASATGGTPTYEYQLEDDLGTTITTYQTEATFTGVPAGDYIVRVRDTNSCSDPINTAITVTAPVVPTFDTIATACYSGTNDASIQVDVTAGNGGYSFSLDGGPFIAATPVTGTTHTFDNLANGTYTIDVRDAYGCTAAQQTITIDPQLVVSVAIVDISACNDGSITVNATGGNGTLVYAIVPANTDPSGLYSTTNFLTVTSAMATANPAGYDVYVLDNNGASPSCSFLQEDIILTPVATLTASGTATDPECFDGLGSIDATVGGGTGPFTYQLVDLTPADGIDYGTTNTNISTTTLTFSGIGVGDYEITVTDTNSCTVTSSTITINNATEITADIDPILPAACNDSDPNEYGFRFDNVTAPSGGTIEYSNDGGANWQLSNDLVGTVSGTEVFPSIRVTLPSGTICQRDFDRYIIPYPLDNLDISISAIVVDCFDLQVRVQGTAGVAPYEYAFSEDPANFDPATTTWEPGGTVNSSGATVPAGEGSHTWTGLTPGRTYVFYVRDDTGCVRQSLINVNDLINEPIEITTDITPTCFGSSTGEIEYTLNPSTPSSHMRWEFFEVGNPVALQTSGGDILYNNTITVTGLPEGEYYIDIVQSDGTTDACRGGSENSYLQELNALNATATATRDISCNLPGLITVDNITGGGGAPYTYDVTGPAGFTALTGINTNPVQIPVNSPAGDYTVTINDQYGCSFTMAAVTLDLSPNPTITSITQDNCSAPIDLTVVGNSAAGNIRYAIVPNGNPAPTTYIDNSGLFENVAAGSYDVYIIDGNGCINSQSAFVVHPVLSAKAELTKVLDCTGSSDAIINIEVLDGSGNYEYSITNTAGVPAVAQTAIPGNPFNYQASAAGDYTVTIYDANTPNNTSCNREFIVTVPTRIEPIVNTIVSTDVTCIGDSDGTISISAMDNGIGPFTFEITSLDGAAVSINPTSSTNTTATFTGLAPTTTAAGYIVTLRGNSTTNNCTTDSASILIAEPATIAVTMDAVVEFGCTTANNQNDASISVASVTGGSNNFVRYEFIKNDNPNTVPVEADVVVQNGSNDTYIETDLLGGAYTINVYDDKGCVGTANATIAPFVEISNPTVTIDTDVSCNPGNDAVVSIAVDLTPPSGTPTLEYSVVGTDNAYSNLNQPTNSFTGIGVGNYEVTVTNADTGCFVQTTFEIEDPNTFEITADTVDVVCNGDDGSVSFTISDSTNPYTGGFTWQIYNSQGTIATGDDTIIIAATGTSANVGPTTPFNIGAGEYRVEVTQDSNPSCVASELFTIAGPSDPISANRIFTDITCVPGNNGTITITDVTGGWGGYSYLIFDTAGPAIDTNDPASYISNQKEENLTAATYQVWVMDSRGCAEQLADVVLADPTPITADLRINQPNCTNFEGEIEVINVLNGQGSNYSYQLQFFNTGTSAFEDMRPIQTSAIFGGLGAGEYQVIVSDQWGCVGTTSTSIDFHEPISPLASVVKTIDCSTTDPGGQITISQTGGSGSFRYDVQYPSSAPATVDDTNNTGVFTNLTQVGDYVFTITDLDPNHGCSTTITQRLETAVIPVLNVDSSTNVTCNGLDDGTISVSVTDNGVGPYTFSIITGPGSSATFPIAATSSASTSAFFDGLEGSIAGITYTIEARGANNCTITTDVTITELNVITVDPITILEYGCTVGNNGNNASVSFSNASGGTGTFVRYVFIRDGSIVQDGSNTTYFETDGLGGSYELRVYDDAGCSALSATDTVLPFVEISDATVTTTEEAACSPLNNAEIEVGVTVSPSSATPNLEYTVTGINVTYSQTIASSNNPETFTGLEVGNYSVSITNLDTGCVINTVHAIDDPDVIEVIATKLTDEQCLNDGVDDGSFSVTINNYTGPYSYQVYDINDNPVVGAGFSGTGNTSSPLTISNLAGGTYYVRITETNAPLCDDDSNVITVLAPSAPITATIREEASVSCTNDQGEILVDPTGGEGPYTIRLENTTTSTVYTETNVEAFIFRNLSAGDFHVTVTDAFSCVFSDNITLIRPDDIVANIMATTLSCFNANTASISTTVGARNITPTYQYQLNVYDDISGSNLLTTSVGQSTGDFNNLAAGFYSVTVSDEVGCSEETAIIEIVNPTEVEASLIRTSPLTCTTGVEFELSATGGSGAYEFSVDNVNWTAMTGNSVNLPLSGMLSAGIYRYYVRDAVNLCTAVQSNSIEEDPIDPLILTVDETAAVINCNGDSTATIYATADGGLGNYQYSLYTDPSLSVASRIAGPQSNGIFSALPADTYYVDVTSQDCRTIAEEVVISEPTALEYTDEVINVTCNGEEDGSITVTLSGGSGGYQYAISPNLNQFDDENTFEDLAPGDYRVIAQDENGCFIELEYTIDEPAVIEVIGTSTPEICVGEENGTIDLTITGGTGAYSSRLHTETNFVQDRTSFTGLAEGVYIIFVRDAQGCEENITVTVEPGVNLNAIVEPVYGCNGNIPNNYVNITLEDSSVSEQVLYGVDTTDPAEMQLNPFFRDLTPGTHYIAISHANGCIRTYDIEIADYQPLTITLEQTNINQITANVSGGRGEYTITFGDKNNGSDNTFYINRTDTYIVTVTDENGCEAVASIYMEFIDLDIPNFFTPNGDGENDTWKPKNEEGFPEILTIIFDRYGREVYRMGIGDPGWNGLYLQKELPSGDYWYVIKLNGENDDREFVGHFTLYR